MNSRMNATMSDASTYQALNELLINLGRSLLQYVGECWPWTDPDTAEEERKIKELVEAQRRQVAQLAELLFDAEWNSEYGAYPTEYTDLHYVALTYLLDQLVLNQRALVEEARRTLPFCDDPEAKRLVGEILSQQQTILHELEQLTEKAPPAQEKTV